MQEEAAEIADCVDGRDGGVRNGLEAVIRDLAPGARSR